MHKKYVFGNFASVRYIYTPAKGPLPVLKTPLSMASLPWTVCPCFFLLHTVNVDKAFYARISKRNNPLQYCRRTLMTLVKNAIENMENKIFEVRKKGTRT